MTTKCIVAISAIYGYETTDRTALTDQSQEHHHNSVSMCFKSISLIKFSLRKAAAFSRPTNLLLSANVCSDMMWSFDHKMCVINNLDTLDKHCQQSVYHVSVHFLMYGFDIFQWWMRAGIYNEISVQSSFWAFLLVWEMNRTFLRERKKLAVN